MSQPVITVNPSTDKKPKPDIVDYLSYDPAKFGFQAPVEKSVPQSDKEKAEKQKQITYKEMRLTYTYPNSATKPLQVEGCQVVSLRGILEKPNEKNGKLEQSIMFSFDEKRPDVKKFVEVLINAYMGSAIFIEANKMLFGMPKFSAKEQINGDLYKNPVYTSYDKTTGVEIKDRMRTMFAKLTHLDFVHTMFRTPGGKEIDWKYLKNRELDLIPVIQFSHIYHSSKPSLQVRLVSAIVTDIRPMKDENLQEDTGKEILKNNPGVEDALFQAMARIELERQDSQLNQNKKFELNSGSGSSDGISYGTKDNDPLTQMKTKSDASFTALSGDMMANFLSIAGGNKPPSDDSS